MGSKLIRTNENRLVIVAAQGQVVPHVSYGVEVAHDGRPFQLPGTGGITYQPRIGDCAFGWEGDHVEPGVSVRFGSDTKDRNNASFNYLCCAGNTATLISGPAKGKKGWVIGHHGGAENVIMDFPLAVLEKMTLDDKIMVRAVGQGLKLLDAPDVTVMNCDPHLLQKIISKISSGMAEVPVAAIVPAEMMGSGLGSTSARTGDYDIMTADADLVAKHGVDKLRFGDLVGIEGHHATWGWTLKKGSKSVGVVIHSDSTLAGHGPGTTTLLTSAKGKIEFVKSSDANVGLYLKSGIFGK